MLKSVLKPIVSISCGLTWFTAAGHCYDDYQKSSSGIEYYDYKVGDGRVIKKGDRVVLDYKGRLAGRQGWLYEDTFAGGEPVRINTQSSTVIEGLRQGLLGEGNMPAMNDGGKRRLLIPSRLGYQSKQDGPLPNDFGQRQRLWSTVLNPVRGDREKVALGDSLTGKLVLDVEVRRVLRTKDSVE
jgi:hypothetical protein